MTFLWPGFMLLLGLIPLIVAAYIYVLRRRRPFAVRYSSLALLREAIPRRSHWRRHLPFALLLLALSGLVTPGEALSGFSSPAVVTVWAMFILSEGLTRTGIADISYWGPELEFYIFDDVRYDQNAQSGYYFIDSGNTYL